MGGGIFCRGVLPVILRVHLYVLDRPSEPIWHLRPARLRSSDSTKKIILLKPRGFCAGVVRAIDVVKIALDLYGPPIYVRKEIVHNRHVVDELRDAGAIFVEELGEVPEARALSSVPTVFRRLFANKRWIASCK